jgi:hypothetical protein
LDDVRQPEGKAAGFAEIRSNRAGSARKFVLVGE